MNSSDTLAILFWISAILIVYVYAAFPLLLFVRSMVRRPALKLEEIVPRVSLVITAHNEAEAIGRKLDNVRRLDYPANRLEVLVASDGSNDGTDEVVRSYAHHGVRLLSFPWQGKVRTLNAAVPQTTGDILVFSDANSMYASDAVRQIVQPFADAAVGGVAGNQVYISGSDRHAAGFGERLYWSLDRKLKQMQSRAGSVIASTGAIHAIRRQLFRPVPDGVSDDFFLSTSVILQGARLVFQPAAMAYETVAPSNTAEYRRKVRVIARGLRGLWAVRGLFNPLRHGFYSVQIFSHKLLRWCVGWLLLISFATSLGLWNRGDSYRYAAVAQLAFLGCAVMARAVQGTRLARWSGYKLLAIPYYFCLANFAAIAAWIQVAGGRRVDRWESKRLKTSSAADGPTSKPFAAAGFEST